MKISSTHTHASTNRRRSASSCSHPVLPQPIPSILRRQHICLIKPSSEARSWCGGIKSPYCSEASLRTPSSRPLESEMDQKQLEPVHTSHSMNGRQAASRCSSPRSPWAHPPPTTSPTSRVAQRRTSRPVPQVARRGCRHPPALGVRTDPSLACPAGVVVAAAELGSGRDSRAKARILRPRKLRTRFFAAVVQGVDVWSRTVPSLGASTRDRGIETGISHPAKPQSARYKVGTTYFQAMTARKGSGGGQWRRRRKSNFGTSNGVPGGPEFLPRHDGRLYVCGLIVRPRLGGTGGGPVQCRQQQPARSDRWPQTWPFMLSS